MVLITRTVPQACVNVPLAGATHPRFIHRCHGATVKPRKEASVLPPSSRHRERIVDQEVMKLRLREERRREAEGPNDRPHGEHPVRPRSLLVAVDLSDDAATAATVA